mmetsp:Transcript_123396/g.394158  ORF Transcript_123396/g.394158 Transcript_123396/m.394158 type:complete len:87 (+) Transcript_123396:519-779(+)
MAPKWTGACADLARGWPSVFAGQELKGVLASLTSRAASECEEAAAPSPPKLLVLLSLQVAGTVRLLQTPSARTAGGSSAPSSPAAV